MGEYIRTIKFKSLDTVNEILKGFSRYLVYRTSLRNVAYLMQLNSFLSQISLNKGLSAVYKFNLLRIRADILENILYCALKDLDKLPTGGGRKKPGLQAYADRAKTLRLISKNTWQVISNVCSMRNYFHPTRQKVLFTEIPADIFSDSEEVVGLATYEIEKYMLKYRMRAAEYQ